MKPSENTISVRGPSGYLRTGYTLDKQLMCQNAKGDWVYYETGEVVVSAPDSVKDDHVVALPPPFKRPLTTPQSDISDKKMSKSFFSNFIMISFFLF